MINFIIFLILTLILIYVSQINLNKKQENPVKFINVLVYLIRFSQFIIMGYVILSFYQMIDFIFNQAELTTRVLGINVNQGISSSFDWGIGVLILLAVINSIILFGILEFTVLILKDLLTDFSFTDRVVKRLKMISNLFVVKIFLSILIHFIMTASLYINTEHVLVYGLMIVLTRIFSHGQNVQEDSDLSI
jgi:hypothetical protein